VGPAVDAIALADLGGLGGEAAEESAQTVISRTAQAQADRGIEGLPLSAKQIAAIDKNPRLGPMYIGRAVHEETAKALENAYPGRFKYFRIGPDYLDTTTGARIELTTPGQIASHSLKPGYGPPVTYATYVLKLR